MVSTHPYSDMAGITRRGLDTDRRVRWEASRFTQEADIIIIIIMIMIITVMNSPFLGCLTTALPATLSASGFQLARLMAGWRYLGLSRLRLISNRKYEASASELLKPD